jgi:hypothetical protein
MIIRSSRFYLGLSAPFRILSQAYHLKKNIQGLPGTTMVYQHLPGTINNIPNPSGPFSNLQVLSVTTKIYQQLPGTTILLL